VLLAHLTKRRQTLSGDEVEQAHELIKEALRDRQTSERIVRGRWGAPR
jgi:hypothetical protein